LVFQPLATTENGYIVATIFLIAELTVAGMQIWRSWSKNKKRTENIDENLTWTIEKELKIKTITVRKKQK
jgi:hypothetical protein